MTEPTAFNITNLPPEAKEAVDKSKTFYQEHKKAVHVAAGVVVFYALHRRGVNKAVVKALKNTSVALPAGMTKAAEHPAKDLMVDDWFTIGGRLYRIVNKTTNDMGEIVTRLIDPSDNKNLLYVLFQPETTLKSFNQ